MSTTKNILVLSSMYHYTHMSQMIDYLAAYKIYSRHNYFYHNFVYDFDPKTIDFDRFDVVMMSHNFWPMNLSAEQRDALAKTKALKALFLQDEYQEIRNINKVMDEMGIDLMFSCVAEKDFDVFYPKKRIKSLQGVYSVLTGYVSDAMMAPDMFQLENKTIDVGFRSRVSPDFLGKIGHEKLRIAEKFGTFAAEQGLGTNISVNEEDRLSGHHWTEFLQRCKTQLGTPSGSSIIDFNGTLMKTSTSYRRAFPHVPFQEVFDANLARHDGKYVIDTISPRTFECAATGSTMVQLEGYYGGFLEPGKHYIEIKSDYSNMSDVVEQIRDTEHCHTIAVQAHKDLIASEKYNFRTHVERIDDIFDAHLPASKPRLTTIDPKAFYHQMIWRHDQSFTMGEQGLHYLDSFKADELRALEASNQKLRQKPFIGKMLSRTGGEPHKKVLKGKVALAIAKKIPEFRALLVKTLLPGGAKPNPEAVLKDILLLSIIKAAHSDIPNTGTAFQTRLKFTDNKIVLEGYVVGQENNYEDEDGLRQSGDGDNDSKNLRSNLFATIKNPDNKIAIDLAKVFPLASFASSTIFSWPLYGQIEAFRSHADLYYNLSALNLLARKYPKIVEQALLCALEPCTDTDMQLFARVFTTPTT
ncbi:MAG: hypothetical protein COA91_08845 [Robiginitomaculum sp.]|nr:MAG: hypothetical protein COA91_08845 [Robiginitomaculum sp.]